MSSAIALGYYIEAWIEKTAFIAVFVASLIQFKVWWKCTNGKLAEHHLIGLFPVMLQSFTSIFLFIDVRQVFGIFELYIPNVLMMLIIQFCVVGAITKVRRISIFLSAWKSDSSLEIKWKSIVIMEVIFLIGSTAVDVATLRLNSFTPFGYLVLQFSTITGWVAYKIFQIIKVMQDMVKTKNASKLLQENQTKYRQLAKIGQLLFSFLVLLTILYIALGTFVLLQEQTVPWDRFFMVSNPSVYVLNEVVIALATVDFIACCAFMASWVAIPDRETCIWVMLWSKYRASSNERLLSDNSSEANINHKLKISKSPEESSQDLSQSISQSQARL
jgi:hypothetical protein